jgi:alpha-tubulin suppressor-like RCC1 family protein
MTIYVKDSSVWRTIQSVAVNQFNEYSWTAVSSGDFHSLALRSDGALFGWGFNNSYQLGLGADPFNKSSPVQIGTAKDWNKITGGYVNSFAIKNNGTLWAWGDNTAGVLGLNNILTTSVPSQIGASSWTQVSTNFRSTAAIRQDGTLWAWGNNDGNQLGVFNTTWGNVYPISSIFSSTTASTTTMLKSDGTLWGLGQNTFGTLNIDRLNRSSPVQIGTDSWYQISSGSGGSDHFILAIKSSDRSLWSWGYNFNGQLGDGTTISRSSPVQIGTSSWSFVDAGMYHSAGITTTGNLFTWGYNFYGSLGDNTILNRSSPVLIKANATDVSCGFYHTLSVISGQGWSWGYNPNGELGDGTTTFRSSPVQLGTPGTWQKVSAGYNHSIAKINTGGGGISLYGWGGNNEGQLSGGYTVGTNLLTPFVLGYGGSRGISQVGLLSAGYYNTFFTDAANGGILYGAGFNGHGIIQPSNINGRISIPVTLQSGGANVSPTFIEASPDFYTFRCVIDGLGYYSGQLFENGTLSYRSSLTTLGSSVSFSSPVQVGSANNWSQVSVGNNYITVLNTNKELYAVGINSDGQLGTNNRNKLSTLTKITNQSWNQVSAGAKHTLAINQNGLLYGWGNNSTGMIGDNTVVNRSSPVQIGTSSWNIVSAGAQESYARKTDGTVWSWGRNNRGQLADGTIVNKSSPVQIGTESFTLVSTAKSPFEQNNTHIMLVRDNSVYTAGWNDGQGQLGDGTVINRSSPVLVASTSTVNINQNIRTIHVNDSGTWRKVFPDQFEYSLTVAANTADFNLRNALVSAGWAGDSPVIATITVPSTFHFYATSTANSGFMCNPALPVGSSVTLNLNGGIWGKGGDGGTATGPAGQTANPGSPGGTGLYVRTPGTAPSEFILSRGPTSRIAGGGGGGAAITNYTLTFFAPPKAGGTRNGSYSGAGGGGGAGFSPATPPGTGAGGAVPAFPGANGLAGTTSGGLGGFAQFISGLPTSQLRGGTGGGLGGAGLKPANDPRVNPSFFNSANGGLGGRSIDGIIYINVTANNGITNGSII